MSDTEMFEDIIAKHLAKYIAENQDTEMTSLLETIADQLNHEPFNKVQNFDIVLLLEVFWEALAEAFGFDGESTDDYYGIATWINFMIPINRMIVTAVMGQIKPVDTEQWKMVYNLVTSMVSSRIAFEMVERNTPHKYINFILVHSVYEAVAMLAGYKTVDLFPSVAS